MVRNTSYKVHVQRETDANISEVNIEQGAMMVSDTGLYMGYNGENVRVYPQNAHSMVQFYTDQDFVDNGANFQIQAHGGTAQVWDIIYFIQKTQSYA